VSTRTASETRFQIDLLHPGFVAQGWQDWLTGPNGTRRFAIAASAAGLILLAVLIAAVLPAAWSLGDHNDAIPALARDLGTRDTELGQLRASLQPLAQEARRQIRWADVLAALSREVPPSLRLQLVEAGRVTPPVLPAQGQATPPPRTEETLRIEALTAARPGGTPLADVAQLIAGLMRDPAVSRRFALKSWAIKPAAVGAPAGDALLTVVIVLAEKAP
jgi:hypothetical protein